jgi:hypothetical protein
MATDDIFETIDRLLDEHDRLKSANFWLLEALNHFTDKTEDFMAEEELHRCPFCSNNPHEPTCPMSYATACIAKVKKEG